MSETKMSRLLAAGAYGCVYHPPPEKCATCVGRSTLAKVCTHGVVKLMDAKSAREEEESLVVIGKIDPQGHYHWKLERVCDAPPSTYHWPRDARGQKCRLYLGPSPKLLYFPYGGRPFEDFVTGKDTFGLVDFLAMRRIFLGIIQFQKHGFVHGDIKGPNLVYVRASRPSSSARSGLPFYIKFIDFSLSFETSDPDLPESVYAYWPPEAILLFSSKSYSTADYALRVREASLGQVQNISPLAIQRRVVEELRGPRFESWLRQMKRWASDRRNFYKTTVREKFDIYGLGVVLLSLYHFGTFSSELRSNETFMRGLKRLGKAGMTFDARYRPSGKEYYRLYKRLVTNAFTPERVERGKEKLGPTSLPASTPAPFIKGKGKFPI